MSELVPIEQDISPAPLWERRTRETPFQYAWFVQYAESGPTRTVQATSKRLGIPVKLIRDTARDWGWDARCAAYDAQVVAMSKLIDPDQSEALATQFAAGQLLLRMGFDALKTLNPAMMGLKSATEAMREGVEMMRRGAGIADLKVDHNVVDRVAEDLELLLGPASYTTQPPAPPAD